jgi:UDP-GlcNAc3NAcA epimerase
MKKKIVTIIGARPQIIKAAAISRCINEKFGNSIEEIIVHTGQHYDNNMSEVFFTELNIPKPHYNLNVGSGLHGKQTAMMIEGIEAILVNEKPNAIVLYGDTNSTVAGALAASKIHVPIVHIEAGLRAFNKKMPEEINRILCDHCSTLLFVPTPTGIENLEKEGFDCITENKNPNADKPNVYLCGDIMYDNSIYFSEISNSKENYFATHNINKHNYVLTTIHRNNNTDEPERLNAIFEALLTISNTHNIEIVLPLHPRTLAILEKNLSPTLYKNITSNKLIHLLEPASFLEMILLEKNAQCVITDSGGVQKEAFFFQKPCFIMRSETEWKEIVNIGAAKIVDANKEQIVSSFLHKNSMKINTQEVEKIFGDGNASEFICNKIVEHL